MESLPQLTEYIKSLLRELKRSCIICDKRECKSLCICCDNYICDNYLCKRQNIFIKDGKWIKDDIRIICANCINDKKYFTNITNVTN